eukprot:g10468.t1
MAEARQHLIGTLQELRVAVSDTKATDGVIAALMADVGGLSLWEAESRATEMAERAKVEAVKVLGAAKAAKTAATNAAAAVAAAQAANAAAVARAGAAAKAAKEAAAAAAKADEEAKPAAAKADEGAKAVAAATRALEAAINPPPRLGHTRVPNDGDGNKKQGSSSSFRGVAGNDINVRVKLPS